jgi:hypothetical protein
MDDPLTLFVYILTYHVYTQLFLSSHSIFSQLNFFQMFTSKTKVCQKYRLNDHRMKVEVKKSKDQLPHHTFACILEVRKSISINGLKI